MSVKSFIIMTALVVPALPVYGQIIWPLNGGSGGCIPFCVGQSASALAGSASSVAVTLPSTPAGNSLVVFGVYGKNGAGTGTPITTVTSADLTFTKLAEFTDGTSPGQEIAIWSAPSSSALTNEVITASTGGGTVNGLGAAAFDITGVYSISSPFDTNASLPGHSTGGSAITVSTSQKRDMLLWWAGQNVVNCTTPITPPTGWTIITGTCGLGATIISITMGYLVVNGTLSSSSYSSGSSEAMLPVITADPH